ncbi:polyphosphate kinase 1 [Arenicella xantha]|uniref:Polyphosphate kinase n=1 Tax=Arenicella xantha TaxID=644221 RepID=A0A395JJV2_9GAMM|nr:polyphosphate kinase 1 [Arenicella xantha]RBP50799.1 polyphosphate kinase [Arenicella xantha]
MNDLTIIPTAASSQPQTQYLNPELSLLSFHERVLSMALDTRTPVLERLKFLCIFSANMDEFFEIRVSGLKAMAQSAVAGESIDGLTPQIALDKISERAHRLVDLQYQTLNQQVLPELKTYGIQFLAQEEWTAGQSKWIRSYFKREVLPILTPIRLDPAHPFPLTINKGLSIVVDLHDPERDETHNIAIVPAPRALPRYIRLPPELCINEYEYVYLSSIISANVGRLFSNAEVLGCYQFRITRNSDLYVDLEAVEDLARTLEGELPRRLYGEAIRLEVSENCPKKILNFLKERFQISDDYIYAVDGPTNLNRLITLPDLVNRPHIKYQGFTPSAPDNLSQQNNIFDTINNADVLLHHPFQSFAPVVELLRQAANDPEVLAIKQTLYRTGSDSVMVEYLEDAARAGKEVTVIVELMARFDEQNNLDTAQKLQSAGAHVVYGMVGKKTHAKMLLIVRREGKKLRRYVHLGTGNYHQGNTRVYTDYGLLTNQREITQDVHELFMQLTTQGSNPTLIRLFQSPMGISDMLVKNVLREADNARAGRPAHVIAKVNGLSSPAVINALYEASQAGVKIDLIVRGICCLRPGIPGLSENIEVRSIVGRFLEHGRVFYFLNSEAESELFLSSADLMPRNLRNRIEQCTPILDSNIKETILADLHVYLADNRNSWLMQADGRYVQTIKKTPDEPDLNAQQVLLEAHADTY